MIDNKVAYRPGGYPDESDSITWGRRVGITDLRRHSDTRAKRRSGAHSGPAAAVTPTEFAWYPTFHTPEGNARPFPIILGHAFSGVVAAMGGSNRDAPVGDSVYGLNDWFMDGVQAEYCLVAAASVAPKPATVDHTLAAAVNLGPDRLAGAGRSRAAFGRATHIDPGGAGGVRSSRCNWPDMSKPM